MEQNNEATQILLVEDDEVLQSLLVTELTNENFAVDTASDGEEGLRLASEGSYRLLLVDIFMPKLDGMGMLQRLREVKSEKELPVIVISNFDSKENLDEAKKYGAQKYFVKSAMSMKEIVAAAKELIDNPTESQPST